MNYKNIIIINNIFQLIYFYLDSKEKRENTFFIIINKNNYFNKNIFYDFFKYKINYIILKGDENFRKFPFSIIDCFKYKKHINKKLSILKKIDNSTNIIFTVKSNIINKILLSSLIKKGFNNFSYKDTSLYSETKKNIKNYLYEYLYKKLFNIKKIEKINNTLNRKCILSNWEKFKYKNELILYLKEKHIKTYNGKYYIFLAQKHTEIGFNDNNYLQFLLKLKQEKEKQGYIFLIKKHPSDNSKIYNNFKIININIPAEFLNLIYYGNIKYGTLFSTSILFFNKKNIEIIKNENINNFYLEQQKRLRNIIFS